MRRVLKCYSAKITRIRDLKFRILPVYLNGVFGFGRFERSIYFSIRNYLNMAPSGRKHTRKSGRTSMEDQVIRAYDFEKEDKKDLSVSEEDVIEGTVYLILLGTDYVLQLI